MLDTFEERIPSARQLAEILSQRQGLPSVHLLLMQLQHD